MLVSRHHELDLTESEIQGAIDLYGINREEAVMLLIADPSHEEKSHLQAKHPQLENISPLKAERMIRTMRLIRCRVRGKAIGYTDHVL
jgi:hypothetical protein